LHIGIALTSEMTKTYRSDVSLVNQTNT